jgi:hypothetical protein
MNIDTFKAAIICLGVGAYALIQSFKKIRIQRLLEDTPTSKTRSAAQGFSEFQGYAWTLYSTTQCSMNHDCVYYHLELQKYVKRGKNSKWETVHSMEHATDFLLVDNTGAIQIQIPGADFQIESRVTSWSQLSEPTRQRLLKGNLSNHEAFDFPPALSILGGLFSGTYRIVEKSIWLGCPLLILGDFSGHTGEKAPTPLTPGLIPFFEKVQSDPRLKIGSQSSYFDLNKNGKVTPDEIRRSLYYIARSLVQNQKTSSSPVLFIPLHGLINKSDNHDLLILDCHERSLVEDGSGKFYLLFCAGVILVVLGIYLALHSLIITA